MSHDMNADIHDRIARHMQAREYDLAEPLLHAVFLSDPDHFPALIALGIVYRSHDRLAAAEACYRRALSLRDDIPELHSNYANLLKDQDRHKEAIHHAERAVALARSPHFLNNLAITYREATLYEKSLATYKACLAEKPGDPDLNFDIGFISLYLRDLKNGWDFFEWRLKTSQYHYPPEWRVPVWTGQDGTRDKKLIVLSEQGFGDTILMSRFMPMLAERFAEVHLTCKPPLRDLLSNLPVKLVEPPLRQERYDYHISMMSIPPLTERDWLKWPAPVRPVVTPAASRKFSWVPQHAAGKLKVGVVWSGSVTFKNNKKRSVSYDRFLRLAADLPDVQFYSLQKGPRERDLPDHGIGTILPIGQMFENFSETSAALEQMDLVVMTDSAVAHLCGSLGVPVLNLLNDRPYWLYMPKSNTTPLYPSMRFIHQKSADDWDGVFEKVLEILSALRANPGPAATREALLRAVDAFLPA